MNTQNKTKAWKIDLQKMPDCEKIKLIKEVREKLQQRIIEAKLWQSLVEAENVIVNGRIIITEQEPLNGLRLGSKL